MNTYIILTGLAIICIAIMLVAAVQLEAQKSKRMLTSVLESLLADIKEDETEDKICCAEDDVLYDDGWRAGMNNAIRTVKKAIPAARTGHVRVGRDWYDIETGEKV